jgi:hypothetical protein
MPCFIGYFDADLTMQSLLSTVANGYGANSNRIPELTFGGLNVTNQVKVLCKLPAGLVIEAGYHLDYQQQQFVKGPNYKRAVLRGALKARLHEFRKIAPTANMPATAEFTPTETLVDEDLAREWFRQHAKDWVVRTGIVAIVEKPADAKDMVRAMESVKTTFEPLNPENDERTKLIPVSKRNLEE